MKNTNVRFVKMVAVTIMLLMNVIVSWAQTKFRTFDLAGPNGPNISLNAVALAIATAETKYLIETDGKKYPQNPEMTKETYDALSKLALEIQEDLDKGVTVNTIMNNLIRSLPNYNSWDWRDSLPTFYRDAMYFFADRWDKTGQYKKQAVMKEKR